MFSKFRLLIKRQIALYYKSVQLEHRALSRREVRHCPNLEKPFSYLPLYFLTSLSGDDVIEVDDVQDGLQVLVGQPSGSHVLH